jgi:four helix bundle suffix protein
MIMRMMGVMRGITALAEMLPLIHQANYLLDQQLRRLEQDFLKQGGLSERMARVRLAYRTQPAKK